MGTKLPRPLPPGPRPKPPPAPPAPPRWRERAKVAEGKVKTLTEILLDYPEYNAAVQRVANLIEERDRFRDLLEERVESRGQPKPRGWAKAWTKRAQAALDKSKVVI